jgi:CheY-like chemotaxis protein
MEAIGTLAGGIAHDFNNVLGAIVGHAALARAELPTGHPALHGLEQINRAALRARRLVQQILAYSRRQPQELVNRPLRPLVEDALALMRATLPAGVALEARLADEPLRVLADAMQMQQVLVNLCTNAWHAMQGKAGRIVVGLEAVDLGGDGKPCPPGLAAGRHAHLWVSDDGCGMDVATRSRIFEPFFTTKPAGHGTGLGLSVVQGIVAAHSGAIAVHSQPGQGSTFDMYFPLAAVQVTVPVALSDFAPLPPAGETGRERHVLYIDDDEVMLLLVEQLLRRQAYRVSCYQNPEEALAALRRDPNRVDVVVSDLNMPQCSGLDVAREIGRIRPELPVVISSGHITPELRAESKRSNVRGLLQKENTLDEIGAVVQRVLQES